ncbi:MAG TPA: acyltransferase [Granulicella sp.]
MTTVRPHHPEQLTAPTRPEQHRFHLLDGLRGIAAVIVVFVHAPRSLRLDPEYGTLAVDFFFCLSGFVIAFSYEARLLQGMRFSRFLILRLCRLYPLYILATFLILLRTPVSADHLHSLQHSPWSFTGMFLLGILAIPNFFTSAPGFEELYPFNSPAWSLFYEMGANLSYALLVSRRILHYVLPVIAAAGALYLVNKAWNNINLNAGVTASGMLGACARIGYSYSAGVYIHKAFRSTTWRASQTLSAIGGVVLPILLVVLLCAPPMQHGPVYQLMFILILCPLLVYCGSLVHTTSALTRLCVFLGTISYPIYMIHPFFSLGMTNPRIAELMDNSPLLARGLYLLSVAIIIGVSWLVARFYDEPVRRRLTAFTKPRSVASPISAIN